jgi:hypothetical protein
MIILLEMKDKSDPKHTEDGWNKKFSSKNAAT